VWFVAAVLAASCVNLSYPPGAGRDGGSQALVQHLGNGKACAQDGDCASAHCADGVCCKTDCAQTCFSCALPGTEGVCMPAPVGMNPRNGCSREDISTCGMTGTCDGAGSCQKYAAGTVCVEASCVARQSMLASRCSADGVCVAGQMQTCSPYLCDVGAKCLTTCKTDDDCANGHKCDVTAGSCGKKALGTSCSDGTECDSTICAQGVCCAVACAGGCLSCALSGSEGACMPLTAGAKPADPTACVAGDPSTCGLDGSCDGAGHCRNFVAGTTCSPATCSTATLRAAGTCDGKAKCQVPVATTCGGFICASASACLTTCTQDADCQPPSVCCQNPANCGAPACGGLSAQYFTTTNLTNMAFSRTDANINFNWGGGSPNPALAVDSFSIRWKGKLTARYSEDYTFFAATDDGERLWVNSTLLINRFVRKASVPEDVGTTTVHLTAGQPVDIVMEYFENGGDASAVLSWQSKSEPKAVIPTSALSPQ
jgi:hypothetical protein